MVKAPPYVACISNNRPTGNRFREHITKDKKSQYSEPQPPSVRHFT
jgi:hypothetical protein